METVVRLLKVRLTNFRRFRGQECLDVSERFLALVGPNEAGKSSLLDALEMLGTHTPPTPRDASRSASEDPARVEGLYVLDAEDRQALTDIHEGSLVTHVWVEMRSSRSGSRWDLHSYPKRDLGPRRRCSMLVKALKDDPLVDIDFSADAVLAPLASEEETLAEEQLVSFESLGGKLRSLDPPEDVADEDAWSTDDIAAVLDAGMPRRSASQADWGRDQRAASTDTPPPPIPRGQPGGRPSSIGTS